MGDGGYWILLWDAFSAGLVMVNPRLLSEGYDLYGLLCNWFPEELTDDEIIKKHTLEDYPYYKIIRSE